MKDVKINIQLADVHTEVRKVTGYLAAKAAQDGTLYQQMSVQREQGEVIGTFVKESLNSVSEVFYIYLRHFSLDGDYESGELCYELGMPSNWPDLEKELAAGVTSYLVHMSVSRWLEMTEPGEVRNHAKEYLEKAIGDIDLMRKLCNRRVRPQRPYEYLTPKEEGDA